MLDFSYVLVAITRITIFVSYLYGKLRLFDIVGDGWKDVIIVVLAIASRPHALYAMPLCDGAAMRRWSASEDVFQFTSMLLNR